MSDAGFGFDLPPHLVTLRDTMEAFVRNEIVPAEQALSPEARGLPADVTAGLQEKARAHGLWCLDAPEQYGGGGLSSLEFAVAAEAGSKHRFSFPQPGGGAFGHPPPIVLYAGTPEQIDRYVVPSIRNGWYGFTAIAEATGGSDPARAIRTTAVRDGDHYVINGTKMWITHAEYAHYGVVYARTGSGISAFVVEAGTPGMEVVRSLPVLRDHWPTELRFDNCRIPAENLIGAEGKGLELAGKWLQRARLLYAARAVGIAEESLRIASDWARVRETFGAVLATRQAVQFAVAESRIDINAARWLVWEAAWKHDQGRDIRLEAAVAKAGAVDAASRTVDRMMQIMGAMGLSRELPLEAWFRDLRTAKILEGSSEMLRIFIARAELGPAASARNKDLK
ncbi:acyl-CoA dehydrogenase family protein [Oryzicola mucosus]|uniref:Acyl-CoA/acyl-ACP dehydrogenase n=1 Tax=Oryzicola mucosus TaxID=2767425 RepID=A0A8J6U606_9HYPH|nr:acyl-CoA dehydrogenase family protein [Oryzicola mucosus]MBD0417370.1 acyl-CoA/acyl-ACP dehydrogenase [Oryzicola mucosus]